MRTFLARHRFPLAVLAVGVVWLAPALWWGLPAHGDLIARAWGADETGPWGAVDVIWDLIVGVGNAPGQRALSPQYPLGQYFVQAFFVWPYHLFVMLSDNLGLGQRTDSPALLMLLHRVPSVLMAAGAAAAAGVSVRRLTDDVLASWVTALAVLTIGPLQFYARTSNVDVGSLFWVALGLLVATRAARAPLDTRAWIGVALCAALGTAAKDQQYAFFLGLAAVLFVLHVRDTRATPAANRWWRAPAIALAVAAATYIVISGAALLPAWFRGHVDYIVHGSQATPPELRHLTGFYHSNPATPAGYANVAAAVVMQVLAAVGLPVAVLALAAFVWSVRRERRLWWIVTVPPLGVLLGVIAPVRFVLPRFLLPVELVVCLLAGLAVAAAGRTGARWRRAAVATAALGLAWTAVRGADLTLQMGRDSRYAAAAWLSRNLVAGDTLGYYGAAIKLPPLRRDIVLVPAPGQYVYGGRERAAATPPPFLIVIPQQISEPAHEWSLPDSTFAGLLDGSRGYAQVLAIQTPALFPRPLLLASYVNPPVRVFARRDMVARVRGARRITIPEPPAER